MDKFNKSEKADKKVKEVVEVVEPTILDGAIPSQLLIIVTADEAKVRSFPTHISQKLSRKTKGAKLSFDEIVTGSLVANSDKWYKIEGGYIHSSQVVEVNEVI